MTIRPLENEDIDKVISIWVASFSSIYDQKKCLSNVSDPNSITLVAENDNEIIGVASLYLIQKLTRKMGLIEDVAVNENYRGNGTGKLLVESLTKLAFQNNCDKAVLNASEKNVPFYEKMGFKRNELQLILRND